MVVDSSAMIAVLLGEPDAADFERKLALSTGSWVSAAGYLETSMVMARESGPEGFQRVDTVLAELAIQIVAVTGADALVARDAFLRYGKGRHRAQLNFGDCFSYALAKRLAEPLLFKGDDFVWTDVLKA